MPILNWFFCCKSEDYLEQRKINLEIEKQLKKDKRESRRELKLLLLGAGESGKSTFIKQMRIIHGAGYSDDDKKSYIRPIIQNILASLQIMLTAMDALQIEFNTEKSREISKHILDIKPENISIFDKSFLNFLSELWNDEGVQKCYEMRREYQLPDSTKYYMNRIENIAALDYVPTEQDILRLRVPTTGILEYQFEIDKYLFRLIDVGGQRGERKKWIHSFEHVTSIIFLVSLSEYDQTLFESRHENRLKESIALFKTIMEFQWFEEACFILFMNKTDLLEEKIVHSHLDEYYPEFKGPRRDALAAREFILNMFLDIYKFVCGVRKNSFKRTLYPHFTCATDTENMKHIFAVVKDRILQLNLMEHNLICECNA